MGQRFSHFPAFISYRSKIRLLIALCAAIAIGASAQNRGTFVYTGNNGLSGTRNQLINGYVINATSGVLSQAAGTPFAAGAQVRAIAGHPSGKFAYAATSNGTVAAFTVDIYTGTLTPVPGSPFASSAGAGGVTILAIDPAGKYLYEAQGNQLYAFSVDSGSGALSAVEGSPYSTTGAVAVDPSDQYLAVSNGSGAWVYAITSGTGALTAVNSMTPGCGGASMTFEPSGHFLYGTYGGITACSFSSTSGGLAPVSGSPFGSVTSFSGLAAHPSGSFLYASDLNCVDNGPSNWLYGYAIDPSSGALTAISGSPFALPGSSGCYYDEDVAAEASGNFVYTVDANYGAAAYKVNQSTGALTLASGSFSSPGAETLTTVPNAISSTATLTGLQIVPGTAQIATSTVGKQYQFTLKGTFSDGGTGFLTGSASWTSSNQTVATVAAGLATSTGYGTTTITATVNGVSTTATLTVTALALSSVTVTPQSTTIYDGTALQLKATGQYADGSSVDITNSVTWTSSNTATATVSATGLVQSLALGNVTISAADIVTGSTAVSVVAAAVTPSGRGTFVYAGGNGYSGSSTPVSGLVINASNGTLSTVSGSPFALPGRLLAIAGHRSGKFVYVATNDGSLSAFTVDSLGGVLTPVPGSPYTVSISGSGYDSAGALLAIDPFGKYLYAAGGSQLYGFAIDSSSGALSPIAGSPFTASGASALAVDPSDHYLVASSGTEAWVYAIDGSTGALTASGSGVNGCGGNRMTFEPSGHFLYGTGGGISACSFSNTSGGLAPVSGSPFASGTGFSGVAAHPSGAFLYASDLNCDDNGPSNWLYGYVIDPSSGALTAIGGSPFALPGSIGCYYDEDVAAEASGNFVYTVDANYGTAAYKVNQSTGALTLASSSFTGPAAFTLTTVPNAISPTAILTGLQIVPATAQIATSTLGKQYQFTLKGTFSDGGTGFLTGSASWTSSNQTVATVAAGLATSTGYGTTTITATLNGVSTTATLTVPTPALTSVTVTPQLTTIYHGATLQLKATGQYADGSSVDITNSVTWTSSNTATATVSATGLVQSLALGNVTISAVDTVTGTASVNIVAPFTWGVTGSNGTSASVKSGGSANFDLALVPGQNFAGQVTVACSNLPPNSTCSANPASVALANGSASNVTVTITTGQTLSGQVQRKPFEWSLALAILPTMALLFPIKRNRWARHIVAGILLLVVIACASCGGGNSAANSVSGSGSGGSGGSGGGGSTTSATPPGTYTVVVTGTTAEHAIQNINLTVQVQ